jgi:hypothetical protein
VELVHEMTYRAHLRPPMDIGGPFGQRMYFDVIDGKLEGPRINGTWRSGGDWASSALTGSSASTCVA